MGLFQFKSTKSNTLLFLFLTLLLSGCFPHGYSGMMQSSACLSLGNFKYVKQGLRGESTSRINRNRILDTWSLIGAAKQQMLEKNPLDSNQALANESVEFIYYSGLKTSVYKCIVTADVVEFGSK